MAGKKPLSKVVNSKGFKKGQLHKDLGVPEGQKIPAAKMQAALRGDYGKKTAERARFAQTLENSKGK